MRSSGLWRLVCCFWLVSQYSPLNSSQYEQSASLNVLLLRLYVFRLSMELLSSLSITLHSNFPSVNIDCSRCRRS